MSKKKSDSALPQGDIYFTEGSNYGLDGYDFDLDYNEGVMQGARLPSVYGLSGLPGDLIGKDTQSEMPIPQDLGFEDKTAANIDAISNMLSGEVSDLSWLEVTEQDLDRLPKNPVDLMIPELVEAWGKNRDKSSFQISPESLDLTELQRGQPKAAEDTQEVAVKKAKLLRKAARDLSFGVDFSEIEKRARLEYKNELNTELSELQAEKGLLGNVYIKAADFPNCQGNSWKDKVAKNTKTAKYLVKASKCHDCVFNQKGSCSAFSKKLVASVPWDKAKTRYEPYLKALGREIDTSLPPKEALKKAFLGENYKPEVKNNLHIQPHIADNVNVKKAFQELSTLGLQVVKFDSDKLQEDKLRARVAKTLSGWHNAGMLKESDYVKLSKSKAEPKALLKHASTLVILNNKQGSYKQEGSGYDIKSQQLWQNFSEKESSLEQEREALKEALINKTAAKLKALVANKLLTSAELSKIAKTKTSLDGKLKLAEAIINEKQLRKAKGSAKIEIGDYYGEGEGALYISKTSMKQGLSDLDKVATQRAAKEKELVGVLKYAKKMMVQGLSGPMLKYSLEEKFDKILVKQALLSFNAELAAPMPISSESLNSPVDSSITDFGLSNSSFEDFSYNGKEANKEELKISFDGMVIE